MPVTPDVELTVPSIPEQKPNILWLSQLYVDAMDPAKPVLFQACLIPAIATADGNITLCKTLAQHINIPNFFSVATAEENTLMLQLIELLKKRTSLYVAPVEEGSA